MCSSFNSHRGMVSAEGNTAECLGSKAELDPFITVKSRRRKQTDRRKCEPSHGMPRNVCGTRKNRRKIHNLEGDGAESVQDIDVMMERARQRVVEDCGSGCLDHFAEEVSARYRKYCGIDGPSEIVCYALGKFSVPSDWGFSCRLQLVVLQQLAQFFKVATYIFDPAFSEVEKEYLETICSFTLIQSNEMAKRIAQRPTLFYMIHSESQLYGNLYQTNYENGTLSNVVMFGNSMARTFPVLQKKMQASKSEDVEDSGNTRWHDYLSGSILHEVKTPLHDPESLFYTALTADTLFHFIAES